MDHDRVRELFSEHLEGELPAADESLVSEHIASCPECGREWDLFRATMTQLRSMGRRAAPVDLEHKVKRRIRARSRGKFFGESQTAAGLFKVPYEFISLIFILVAMAIMYLMTLVYSVQIIEGPREKPLPPPMESTREAEPASDTGP